MIEIGNIKVMGSALYQWEIGRKVQIVPTPNTRVVVVQFAHLGDAETLNVEPREENGLIIADIPNILLQSGEKIAAFLVDVNESCVETTSHMIFPVISRPKPNDYVYTETEVMSWQALEARIREFTEEVQTAYDIAVKYGYKGTEEEWIAELQGNAAQSAARAEEAQNKAEEAQKKAEEAKGHAKDYANSAAQQAQSASNFVGTASAYASNAEQSAKTAATKANSAADYSRNALENAANTYTYYKLTEKAETSAQSAAANAAKSEENAKASEEAANKAKADAENASSQALNYSKNAQSHQQGAETARSQASTYSKTAASSADRAEGSATAAAASAEEAKKAAEEAKNAGGGSGITVTAKPGQLIRVKEVDENGNPTAWEAVPWGYTEDGRVEVLAERTITIPNSGMYDIEEELNLTIGKIYIVNWNGVEYPCVAQDLSALTEGACGLGNYVIAGLPDTGEPFMISSVNNGTSILGYDIPGHGATPVSISIYQDNTVNHPIPGELLPEGVPYVEKGGMVVILPECQPIYEEADQCFYASTNTIPSAGSTCVVNWNGVEYTCIAQDLSAMLPGAVLLGDGGLLGLPSGRNEPFGIVLADFGEVNCMILDYSGATEVTISIKGESVTAHKIDIRCLPDLGEAPIIDVTNEDTELVLDAPEPIVVSMEAGYQETMAKAGERGIVRLNVFMELEAEGFRGSVTCAVNLVYVDLDYIGTCLLPDGTYLKVYFYSDSIEMWRKTSLSG